MEIERATSLYLEKMGGLFVGEIAWMHFDVGPVVDTGPMDITLASSYPVPMRKIHLVQAEGVKGLQERGEPLQV